GYSHQERFILNPAPRTPNPAPRMSRFLLWIDSVGGYLVCRGDEVTLGQAVPESGVEVPILADISRRHATIRRDGEGYLLVAHGPARVDGRPVDETAYLKD